MRRAQLDVITFGLILFVFAIATIIAFVVFVEFNSAFNTDDRPQIVRDMLDRQTTTFTMLDYIYIFLTVGLLASLFITGFFVDSHPIFIFVSVILAIVDVVLGAILANAYNAVAEEFPTVAASLPVTVQIASNWPLVLLVGAVMLGLGLYTKGGREVGQVF